MITLASHNDCTGCSACFAACPRGAISMGPDNEGFLHPSIDVGKCVNCGLCEKACPVIAKSPSRKPIAVFAAKSTDDKLRMKSSSGGVFSLLARQVIFEGGIVFGAGFDHDDWHVMHKSAENEEELDDLRGSKYVQSEMGDTYSKVREELLKGRKVLFTGTPCQIAGLRFYLGKEYDNLLLVDVICHATPSPLAWQKYLGRRLAEVYNPALGEQDKINKISFRDKVQGWRKYSISLVFGNDKEYCAIGYSDSYIRGFLGELYNRRSCHNCSFRELKSGSDLTLGDYWNVHKRMPEMDDDKGTSLILVNTSKGEVAWDVLKGSLTITQSDYEDAVRVNPAIAKSPVVHRNRNKFFKCFRRAKDFDSLVTSLLSPPLWRRAVSLAKRIIKKAIGR